MTTAIIGQGREWDCGRAEPEPPPRSYGTGKFAPNYYDDWRGRR